MGLDVTNPPDNQANERQARLPEHPHEVPRDDPRSEADANAAVGEPRRRIHAQTAYAVALPAAPSTAAPKLVVNALAAVTRDDRALFGGAVVRHARRRLTKDSGAAESLRQLATSQDTPLDLAVQVAALMATVPRHDRGPDVVDACLGILNNAGPTLVRDPVLGATVSAKVSLLKRRHTAQWLSVRGSHSSTGAGESGTPPAVWGRHGHCESPRVGDLTLALSGRCDASPSEPADETSEPWRAGCILTKPPARGLGYGPAPALTVECHGDPRLR